MFHIFGKRFKKIFEALKMIFVSLISNGTRYHWKKWIENLFDAFDSEFCLSLQIHYGLRSGNEFAAATGREKRLFFRGGFDPFNRAFCGCRLYFSIKLSGC